MVERNLTPEQERHVESHTAYMKVFWALLVLTILEYAYARFLEGRISFAALVGGLMVLALTKAFLVGWYFMHLKFEGRWVYMMLIPAAFLATVVVTGLTPDMAFHRLGFYESPAVASER
jgi:cytochrome c oxidase subunit IV